MCLPNTRSLRKQGETNEITPLFRSSQRWPTLAAVADCCGYSPLHQAATEGHEEVVRLLVKHNVLVDIQDEMHANTALHEAAWKGYSRTIEILCKHKANVYIKNKGGFSPLHLACQNGHNQSTRILLLAGCKPDIKNNSAALRRPLRLERRRRNPLPPPVDIGRTSGSFGRTSGGLRILLGGPLEDLGFLREDLGYLQ
ncbi:hypothetical protein ISCGN_011445 [Ixodes scapularis]